MLQFFFASLLFGGCQSEAPPARSGAQVYAASCANCHLSSGEGSGRFYPPLAGSECVVGDSDTLIRIVMHGIKGEITVKGKDYNNIMPPWGGALTDEELSNVLSYIRSSWGNGASPILKEDVALIRKEHKDQTLWTVEKLQEIIELKK